MHVLASLVLFTLLLPEAQLSPAAAPVDETGSEAPVEEIDEPREPAEVLKKRIAKGRSAKLESGAPHGVWIWRDGNRWHLRTTTKSAKHRFTGLVATSDKARLQGIRSTKTELADRIKLRDDDAIRFDFTTHGHEDGFDFEVKGKGCVRFAIEVDGEPAPQLVKLGKTSAHPTSWHFKLCS